MPLALIGLIIGSVIILAGILVRRKILILVGLIIATLIVLFWALFLFFNYAA